MIIRINEFARENRPLAIAMMLVIALAAAMAFVLLFADGAQAHSTYYCPNYDYWRNGYFWDFRYQYTNGSGHYHVYWRSGDGALIVRHRWCAL